MKISVPTVGKNGLKEDISGHFGRAPTFTFYDTDTEKVEVVENTSEHMGGEKKPPRLLADEDVDVLLCGNLGRKAVSFFDDLGIEVYIGADKDVEDAIEKWSNGDLDRASRDDVCEGHH